MLGNTYFVAIGYNPVTVEDMCLNYLSKDLNNAICGTEGGGGCASVPSLMYLMVSASGGE